MRITGLTTHREQVHLTAADFDDPPRAIGHIELPEVYAPNRQDFQREVAQRLERATTSPRQQRNAAPSPSPGADLALLTHPVADDPDLDERLRLAGQAERIGREVEELRQRVRGRGQSVARDFDRVLRVLDSWGYVDGLQLTDAGRILARTFHE